MTKKEHEVKACFTNSKSGFWCPSLMWGQPGNQTGWTKTWSDGGAHWLTECATVLVMADSPKKKMIQFSSMLEMIPSIQFDSLEPSDWTVTFGSKCRADIWQQLSSKSDSVIWNFEYSCILLYSVIKSADKAKKTVKIKTEQRNDQI